MTDTPWFWYAAMGLAALSTVALHGSLWVALKAEGTLRMRARRAATRAWWVVAGLTAAVCSAALANHPGLIASFTDRPFGMTFPIVALTGLLGTRLIEGERSELLVYAASCVFILGVLSTGVYGVIGLP